MTRIAAFTVGSLRHRLRWVAWAAAALVCAVAGVTSAVAGNWVETTAPPLSVEAMAPQALADLVPGWLRNPNDDPAFGDAVAYEEFGRGMALDGTTLAVGSFTGQNINGVPTGAVHVFVRSGNEWVVQARLVAPDGQAWDGFGDVLALQGDTLVVGAPNASRDGQYYLGRAYVFERNAGAWAYVQTLTEAEPTIGAFLGGALALDGDMLAVGAPQRDVGGTSDAGAVVMFQRSASGWQFRQSIVAPTPSTLAMFGSALHLSGNELIIGAYGEDLQAGAAYAYAREQDVWTMQQRLVAAATAQSDFFGYSLAGDGQRLLIGAPAYLDNRSGTAVEWQRVGGAWVEARTLHVDGQADLHHFGWRLARHAGQWLVGSERKPSVETMTGVDLFTYEVVGAGLERTRQTTLPYVGRGGYGLRGLALNAEQIFVGLPSSISAPWSDAGEVRVQAVNPPGISTQTSIHAGVTATYESFGTAVAATANWLMVGTPYERRQSANAGAVFVYPRNATDGTPVAVLKAADGARNDQFGATLAFSADTLLVGAPADNHTGSVRLYEHDGSQWIDAGQWFAPGVTSWSQFGRAIAADATSAVVGGVTEQMTPQTSSGVVYVYQRAVVGGWSPPVRLVASDAASGIGFGAAVAVDGGSLVVGGLTSEVGPFGEPLVGEGAAYVFVRNGSSWSEQARLVRPPSPDTNGEFGSAVAIDGDVVFVGAPRLREVHVFERNGTAWQWTQRIPAPAGVSDAFGARLWMENGELWVGARADYASNRPVGSLHRFRETAGGWRLVQSISSANPSVDGTLGEALDVEGDTVFAGAPSARGYAAFVRGAGAVYVDERALQADGFE